VETRVLGKIYEGGKIEGGNEGVLQVLYLLIIHLRKKLAWGL
jgi:hypothetical protein